MNMFEEGEDTNVPLSASFQEEPSQSSEFKVKHKFTLGDTTTPTYCVRFDYNDKYIAASCGDGSIRIFNVFTQKQSYVLNTDMQNKMPTTNLRWRPLCAPGVTKNVLIATNADGSLTHFHTTSGKQLNRIFDIKNQLLTADYKQDGKEFLTAGEDWKIRIYDEQTRQFKMELEPGAQGNLGHNNRIFCAKFVQDDPNLIVSGGWDKNVKVWDMRDGAGCVRSIYGPNICGDSIDVHDGFILTGQQAPDKQLQLWYLGNGQEAETISFDEKLPSEKPVQLYCAQFQKNTYDLIVAGGSGANEVKVFDGDSFFEPCYRIYDLSRACFTCDFSNTGETFAIGGGDGVVRVFEIQKER